MQKTSHHYLSSLYANLLQKNQTTFAWASFVRHRCYTANDIIVLVKDNETVQIRMKDLIRPARYRSNNAVLAIYMANDVLGMINYEINTPVLNEHSV